MIQPLWTARKVYEVIDYYGLRCPANHANTNSLVHKTPQRIFKHITQICSQTTENNFEIVHQIPHNPLPFVVINCFGQEDKMCCGGSQILKKIRKKSNHILHAKYFFDMRCNDVILNDERTNVNKLPGVQNFFKSWWWHWSTIAQGKKLENWNQERKWIHVQADWKYYN